MSASRRWCAGALAGGLLAIAWPAAAQERSDLSLAQHFEQCNDLLARMRAAQAVDCFRTLLARSDEPTVQYNLAFALRAVGRNREAAANYRAFIARAQSEARLAEYVRRASEAARDLSRSMGRLALTTTPADARVTLDGEDVPRTADVIEADPGAHTVVVQAPGHATLTRAVHLNGAMEERLHVELTPLSQTGHLRVDAEPDDAAIALDGAVVGHGRVDEPVRIGRHKIDVTALGYAPFHREVDVARDARISVRAALSDERLVTSRTWFKVTVGVAVTAAIVGAVIAGIYLFSSTEEPYQGALYNVPPMGR